MKSCRPPLFWKRKFEPTIIVTCVDLTAQISAKYNLENPGRAFQMKKTKHSEEKIIAAVKQLESGWPQKELARELGVTDQTLYNWKSKYSGVCARWKRRTGEKEMVAALTPDKEALKTVIRKNGWSL